MAVEQITLPLFHADQSYHLDRQCAVTRGTTESAVAEGESIRQGRWLQERGVVSRQQSQEGYTL